MELKPYKTGTVAERYIKGILPIMLCVLLVYTSCRKDSTTAPSTQTANATALNKQIALNLSKSLAGSFGGVNLNDGVNVTVAGHLGPHHDCGCTNNPLCGFVTDSLVNYNATIGDTTIHTGGNLKFYFNCVNGKLSGYTAYDSLNTVKTAPASVSTYRVQQYYTIVALDSAKNFIGVNGTNDLHTSITYTNGSPSEIGGAFYELSNLKIDVINKDILSGTATFQAYGSNWNAKGTIVFLGNHQADFTSNGVTTHITVTF
jgi:hypothetical protein